MMLVRKSSAVAVSFLAISTVCYAQDDARPVFYVGVGGSYIFENFEDANDRGINVDGSLGFNAKLGARFQPNFAVELDYLFIDGFDLNDVVELDGFTYSANGKGYLSTGRIQPYGLFGVGWADLEANARGLRISSSASDLFYRFGVGADMHVTEHITFYLEASYDLATGDIKKTDFIPVTVGLQYRF